jgi:methylated-DNA-[protein]-cysteine S-methyltransferase
MQIPYGETCSYQDIAIAIGKPNACRAVGMANHVNPISIIVPCHRVIGKTGRPAGYGGGLEKQAYLLELENKYK